jgi:hypothetical protein
VCGTFSERPFIFLLQSIVFGARMAKMVCWQNFGSRASFCVRPETGAGRDQNGKPHSIVGLVAAFTFDTEPFADCTFKAMQIEATRSRADIRLLE